MNLMHFNLNLSCICGQTDKKNTKSNMEKLTLKTCYANSVWIDDREMIDMKRVTVKDIKMRYILQS